MLFSKTKDIITVFHKASEPASKRIVNALKQASAAASSAPATMDQASATGPPPRDAFDVDATEANPTMDQLRSILQYAGNPSIPAIISGAKNEEEALKKFKETPTLFQKPVVVDWHNGKAIAARDVPESQILSMLQMLPGKQH